MRDQRGGGREGKRATYEDKNEERGVGPPMTLIFKPEAAHSPADMRLRRASCFHPMISCTVLAAPFLLAVLLVLGAPGNPVT